MENHFSQKEIKLLLVIQRLAQIHTPITRQAVTRIAEIKFPDLAESYDQIVARLQEKDLLQNSQEELILTAAGKAELQTLVQRYSLNALFYDAYYQAVLTSRAHALFCERVYGRNLAQHGMTDMAQIALLLEDLQIASPLSVLDFGCGDGRISEYISDTTGACVAGLDIASQAIELARQRTRSKQDRLHFYCANFEELTDDLPPAPFDRIIAIDSIFFAKDQKALLERLLSLLKPGGKMGIFYHCPPTPEPDAQQTVLGQALTTLGLSYSAKDLSEQNYRHWTTKRSVLQELETLFCEEGHGFLFKNRMAECQGDLEHFHRYLFIVKTD